ncbi:glycoside hydrolase family 9 protein [Anseongella ginsenosidimutans]|uniref:glycoside hydrolase family 9 protein n=1 Tax=Anseongella ginsenosidimutans TaxID=496056 RepID=UPI001CEF7C83|nr:glycoside hydrolase family 9 protein [Anseongella ginsenosidimutans]
MKKSGHLFSLFFFSFFFLLVAAAAGNLAAPENNSDAPDAARGNLDAPENNSEAADSAAESSWIRVNQMGYLPESIKTAVLLRKEKDFPLKKFELRDALTNEVVYQSGEAASFGEYAAFSNSFRLDFSEFKTPGAYYITAEKLRSPVFRIAHDAYQGAADFLLKYMRQQRCGYNPYLKDSCHVQDGYIIYHPTLDSTHINVTGGWHDASDYLQYVATSANAVFQMLLAYEHYPAAFGDAYNASGEPGKNGIPDILDEAKWGLDWLVRMNPAPGMMFNQIADDRDHGGFRLPTEDTISYGKGLKRPVYFVNGKPQGLYKYQNRTTGVASTAGKYASAFALGAMLLEKHYPEFSQLIDKKAVEAYEFGLSDTGACQTAPCRAPYFYEEDNWTDDMELAAAQLFRLTGKKEYLQQAAAFGRKEPKTPWMGADTARHYQWYPFFNAGHYFLAAQKNSPEISDTFRNYYRDGLEAVLRRGEDNPFLNGIPFIWCSNNLTTALLSQSALYRKASGDTAFLHMEASLRDWLFGSNPWGTSMIVGLPGNGDTPVDPHSAFTALHNFPIDGGLVDGPVYGSIFASLKGIHLAGGDEYAPFQSRLVVYHDDYGDYSTNEPTMDGTACLTYYLAALGSKGLEKTPLKNTQRTLGAVTRMDSTQKNIYLIFSAHDFNEGGTAIRESLAENDVPASFFFTGEFYNSRQNRRLIRGLKDDGHYLGPHSGAHLLYAPGINATPPSSPGKGSGKTSAKITAQWQNSALKSQRRLIFCLPMNGITRKLPGGQRKPASGSSIIRPEPVPHGTIPGRSWEKNIPAARPYSMTFWKQSAAPASTGISCSYTWERIRGGKTNFTQSWMSLFSS